MTHVETVSRQLVTACLVAKVTRFGIWVIRVLFSVARPGVVSSVGSEFDVGSTSSFSLLRPPSAK